MKSQIPELKNSRFWLFKDKFVIVKVVLNIIVQATAYASLFFYIIKIWKMKEQLIPLKSYFFYRPTVYTYFKSKEFVIYWWVISWLKLRYFKIVCKALLNAGTPHQKLEQTFFRERFFKKHSGCAFTAWTWYGMSPIIGKIFQIQKRPDACTVANNLDIVKIQYSTIMFFFF